MRYLNSVLLDEEDSNNSVYGTSIDILQLVVLEELKRVCKANPLEKGKYMKSIFNLALSSKSHSVLFECANTIIQLTSLANHIKLAVSTYLKLLNDPSSDNNMKLILVENLLLLKVSHKRILQDQSVEILRALSSPSIDIRTTCINLVLELLTDRNVEEVIRIFKKELLSVQGKKEEIAYQDLLVNALHTCAVNYPGITEQVGLVEVLMDSCLLQEGTDTDVSSFIQQIVVEYESLRPVILNKLFHIFGEIVSASVYRTALWILSEFSEDSEKAINCILSSIGEGPYFNKKERNDTIEIQDPGQKSQKTIILPDGTYGTQIISAKDVPKPKHLTGLRKLLTEVEEVDYYLITIIAKSFTKLFQRVSLNKEKLRVEVLSVLCGIVQIKSYPKKSRKSEEFSEVPASIDPENFEQVIRCLQCLTGIEKSSFVQGGLQLYSSSQRDLFRKAEEASLEAELTQPDDLIAIKQLRGKDGISDLDFSDDSLTRNSFVDRVSDDFAAKLNNVRTLTGLDDVVFVEVSLKMNHYDIVLDFGAFNRSTETLKNVTLEIAVDGELKLVEKPQIVNIGPSQTVQLKACVKVNSTEAGVIFGNLTYDTARGGNVKVIALNEIVVDTIEYIYPATCSDSYFRKMWQEFKWEYPVAVMSSSNSLEEFVRKIANKANMQILTHEGVLKCNLDFLVCNMYAKSRFNEDALMNVSLEMKESGIAGSVRIRAKTQGMAKCLGLRVLEISRLE
jgi:coatomer subunit beta